MIIETCLCLAFSLGAPSPVTIQQQLALQHAQWAQIVKGSMLAYRGVKMIHDGKINIRILMVRF